MLKKIKKNINNLLTIVVIIGFGLLLILDYRSYDTEEVILNEEISQEKYLQPLTQIAENTHNSNIERKQNIEDYLYQLNEIKEYSLSINMDFLNEKEDLLTLNILSDVDTFEEKVNLDGKLELENEFYNFVVPIKINDLKEKSNVYLEITDDLKPYLNMKDYEDFLYFSKNNLIDFLTYFGLFYTGNPFINTRNYNETNEFDLDFNNIGKVEKVNDTSFIYSFNTDDKNVLDFLLKSQIGLFSNLFYYLNESVGLSSINNIQCRIIVRDEIIEDIVFILEDKINLTSHIVIKINEINQEKEIKPFYSCKVKNINDTSEIFLMSSVSNNINSIYFSYDDSSEVVKYFEKDNLPNNIIAYVNFKDTEPNSNFIIKWYFENTNIPILETKVNNGEYKDGIFKSCISFTNKESVQTGIYVIKIFSEDGKFLYEDYFMIFN